MINNHGANNDDTQVFGSVEGSHPRQVFPDSQQPVYQQSVQYEEPPHSYEVPAGKTSLHAVDVVVVKPAPLGGIAKPLRLVV